MHAGGTVTAFDSAGNLYGISGGTERMGKALCLSLRPRKAAGRRRSCTASPEEAMELAQ